MHVHFNGCSASVAPLTVSNTQKHAPQTLARRICMLTAPYINCSAPQHDEHPNYSPSRAVLLSWETMTPFLRSQHTHASQAQRVSERASEKEGTPSICRSRSLDQIDIHRPTQGVCRRCPLTEQDSSILIPSAVPWSWSGRSIHVCTVPR